MKTARRTTLAALALFSAGVASAACTGYTVAVEPLSFTTHDTPVRALQRDSSTGFIAYMRATTYVNVIECHILVGYRDVEMHIASELRANSCAYAHVLGHEMTHARIYQVGLDEMRATLAERAIVVGPIAAAHEAFDKVRAAHAAHDSPAEYRLNITACRGAVMRLIDKAEEL